jgi:hypothetical protein
VVHKHLRGDHTLQSQDARNVTSQNSPLPKDTTQCRDAALVRASHLC